MQFRHPVIFSFEETNFFLLYFFRGILIYEQYCTHNDISSQWKIIYYELYLYKEVVIMPLPSSD